MSRRDQGLRTVGIALIFILTGTAHLAAEEFFALPKGAGSRTGEDWNHALDASSLQQVLNERMEAGDQLYLGSGDYQGLTLRILSGGSADQPKRIQGIDLGQGLPVLIGDWTLAKPDKGPTAIFLAPGLSHVRIESIRIQNYQLGVHAPGSESAMHSHLVFRDVDMSEIRYGFYLSHCADLTVQDCDLTYYSKHGFRLNQNSHRVVFRRCVADGSAGDPAWEAKTEKLPFGFVVNQSSPPHQSIRFEDCLAQNNMMPLQDNTYKNGDGFVVEATASDVRFIRCRAFRNQDGGFDLKPAGVYLKECVSVGNSRNFRLWSDAILEEVYAGMGRNGLWSNGGAVTVRRSLFHDHTDAAVLTDDRAIGPVTLVDCLISATAKAYRNTAKGKVILEDTAMIDPPANPQAVFRYPEPTAKWEDMVKRHQRLRKDAQNNDSSVALSAEMLFPGKEWRQTSPEEQGMDSRKLGEAITYLKNNSGRDGVGELVIVRKGRLIYLGENADKVHGVWSLTKSFTSTALGLLVDKGNVSIDTAAHRYVPEMKPHYSQVTLRHFMTMTSGYRARGDEPKGAYRHGPSSTPFQPDPRPLFPPGAQYAYWDSAMNQFALVLTRIASEPLEDLFRREIAHPIGLPDAAWDWGDFGKSGDTIVNGGSGNSNRHIKISARALARFGLLLLNNGRWEDRQLLSAEWIQEATRPQVPASLPLAPDSGADGRGVYGFNFWVNGVKADGQRKWPGAPPRTFAASGYNNNDMFLIPEWDMVIVRLGLDQGDVLISDSVYSHFLGKVGASIIQGNE